MDFFPVDLDRHQNWLNRRVIPRQLAVSPESGYGTDEEVHPDGWEEVEARLDEDALEYQLEFIDNEDLFNFEDLNFHQFGDINGPHFLLRNNFDRIPININWRPIIEHPRDGLMIPADRSRWRSYNDQIQFVLDIANLGNPQYQLSWLSSQLIDPTDREWFRLTFYHHNDVLSNPWLTQREIDYQYQPMAYTAFRELRDHRYIRNSFYDIWLVRNSRNQMYHLILALWNRFPYCLYNQPDHHLLTLAYFDESTHLWSYIPPYVQGVAAASHLSPMEFVLRY